MNRVILKPIKKDRWELVQDYEYESSFGIISIPKGFVTNGANIPRVFWSLFPPNSPEYISAATIHDYLCLNAYKDNKNYAMFCFADKVFYECLRKLNVNKFKAKIFYIFCRAYHYVKYK